MHASSVQPRLRVPRLRGRRGFTLIEVMLAAVASAMIMLVIFGIFVNAMHLRDKATTLTQRARQRTRAEGLIRSDLANAYISGSDPSTANAIAGILNGSQQSHGSQFPGYLQFTATTAELSDDQIGGNVQAIEYYIDKDPKSPDSKSGMLVRTENRVILASTQTQQQPEEPILSGATALNVEFYDGSEWQQSWSYVNAGDPLPEAIKIDVSLAPPDDKSPAAPPIEVIVPWETQPFFPAPTTSSTGGSSTSGTSGGGSGGESKSSGS